MLHLIVCYNCETRQILGLGVPFNLSALMGTVVDIVLLLIFTAMLRSDIMVAGVMVDAIVDVSFNFTGAASRRCPFWGAWPIRHSF